MLLKMVGTVFVGASALIGATYKAYVYGRQAEQIAPGSTQIVPLEEVTLANFLDTMAFEGLVWFISLPENVRESVRSAGKSLLEIFDVSRDTVLDDESNNPFGELAA